MPESNILFPEVEKMPVFWANLLANEKIVINQGGTNSTKSQSLIRCCFVHGIEPNLLPLIEASKNKGIKVEVVASTFPKLQGDTLEIAEELYSTNSILKSYIKFYNQSKHTFYLHNGSKVVFRAYEKPKDAEGPKRDVLYINECRNLPWATASNLIVRTRYKTYLDYNPTQQFWAHDKIINCPPNAEGEKEFPSVKVIRSWHIHNNFISEQKHKEIESISDPELWKAYARGLTAKVTGLVYPGWDCIPDDAIPKTENYYWGIDYGYTNDPTALVKIYEDVVYGGVKYDYLFDEVLYATGTPTGFIYQKLEQNGYKEGQPLYSEHDKTIIRELRQLGVSAIPAIKGPGSLEARVLFLRSKKCAFTKRSVNIAEEVSRYSFLEGADGKPLNRPEDRYNHSMDASGYGAFTNAIRMGKINWSGGE